MTGRYRSIKLADARGQRTREFALRFAQIGTPDVEDQNGARLIAVVLGFVVDRVVEYKSLSDLPPTLFPTHAKAAAWRHDER